MKRRYLALALLLAGSVHAEDAAPPEGQEPAPDRPEYRARGLPTDTFTPSEKVQEDFSVPFPEDI